MPSARATESPRILVGTASWSDPGFVERWYPPKLPAGERLPWYAQHFDLVEVNSSFYAVPEPRLVERWCASTPNEFVFDFKLHRLLSRHAADAKTLPPALRRAASVDAKGKVKLTPGLEAALLETIVAATEPLRGAGKFGAFLLQLSPAFSPRRHELSELEPLLSRLAPLGLGVELRNRNWALGDELSGTLEFFEQRNVSLVLVDAPPNEHFTVMPSELNEITNSQLAYVRLHGRDPEAYLRGKTVAERFNYDYTDKEIDELAERAKKLGTKAKRVHVIFNNNALDYAPQAAARMRAALRQIAKAPPRQGDLFR